MLSGGVTPHNQAEKPNEGSLTPVGASSASSPWLPMKHHSYLNFEPAHD